MVIKPLAVGDAGRATLDFPSLALGPGQLRRFMVAVPEAATWAKVFKPTTKCLIGCEANSAGNASARRSSTFST
jgi:hypothetical protein